MAAQPIASVQQGMKFTLTTTCDAFHAHHTIKSPADPPFAKPSSLYPDLIPLEFFSRKCYCSPRYGFTILSKITWQEGETLNPHQPHCGMLIAGYRVIHCRGVENAEKKPNEDK
jgi:hypothetical protein